MKKPKHFLSLLDLSTAQLQRLIARAIELKHTLHDQSEYTPLKGKTLIMVFEKSSTRTRLSFEIAMQQLGGTAIFLSSRDSQLGRGEPIEDSARVLSRLADALVLRTTGHDRLIQFAHHSSKPVINGLSNDTHPCQLLADMMTYQELRGSIKGKKVVWVGDGNNMCHTYIDASKQFSFHLHIACPPGFEPQNRVLKNANHMILGNQPEDVLPGADLVVTDVWASMGQEEEQQKRLRAFSEFQINAARMRLARSDALFLHCLPAHRGEEVSAEVLEGPQSAVWDAAENRMHSQKALLELLL